ncbi:MAG: general secretion pathway protein GspB [Desulfofustis sp.]|nr:general secretion pathway protein GspB [Desulfofustis sp.]
MSSILKALKKIDETSRSSDNGHPWPQPGARDAISRNIKKRWLVRQLTTYALVAACLISLVVLLYWRQTGRPPQRQAAATKPAPAATEQVHRAKIERPPAPGSQPDSAGRQMRPATRSEPIDKPAPAAMKTESNMRKAPAEAAARNITEDARIPEPRKPLPKRSMKAETKVEPQAVARKDRRDAAPTPVSGSAKASRIDKAPEYSRLQNSDLVLQAIAWSPEPDNRIAVINGSIVREGETIDGFTLEQIRPDDIVLNDGGKRWQLEFGLKR